MPVAVQSQAEFDPPSGENYLRVRLLTPLKSRTIARGEPIEAAVSEPYYNADHFLLYPAGTKLEGTVSKAKSAGWMKRNGALLFSFHSVLAPDGTTSSLSATVTEVEAAGSQALAIGQEGDIKATTSILARLRALSLSSAHQRRSVIRRRGHEGETVIKVSDCLAPEQHKHL